jgi:hypothetical protein
MFTHGRPSRAGATDGSSSDYGTASRYIGVNRGAADLIADGACKQSRAPTEVPKWEAECVPTVALVVSPALVVRPLVLLEQQLSDTHPVDDCSMRVCVALGVSTLRLIRARQHVGGFGAVVDPVFAR